MRLLTSFEDAPTAQLFVDVLYAEGIGATVKETVENKHALWVHEEDRVDDAKRLLLEFDANDSRFSQLQKAARQHRQQEQKADRQLQQRTEKIRSSMEARASGSIGTITLALIIVCIAFAAITELGDKTVMVDRFMFTEVLKVGNQWVTTGLGSITREPWRALTPIFIHFGFIHIFFNLWWMKDLGTLIERAFSSFYLLAMVLVIGVLSNFAQYYFGGPTRFGGMSGVVYGLFAFLWIRGRFDSSFPYRIPNQLVTFMLLWLAFGFTGVFAIANGAHAGGLVAGALWGFLSSGYLWKKR